MLFKEFVKILNKIDPITERTKIREIIKDLYLIDKQEADIITYLLNSTIFKSYEGIELNVGQNILEEAIAKAYGYTKTQIKKHHLLSGDLGKTAEFFAEKRKQKSLFLKQLDIKEVYNELRNIALEQGKNSTDFKKNILISLLNNSSSLEAKYIVKIILGTLRINIGNQTLIEAIVLYQLELEGNNDYKEVMSLFKKYKELIEQKTAITNDLGFVLKVVLTKGIDKLKELKIKIGIPIKSQLAEREKNAELIIKRLNYCIVEAKYDGFRLQIHHKKDFTKIFSRRGEDLTNMFPEFVNLLKDIKEPFIFDSEALGFNPETKKYLSFQETIKRKRKYNVKETSEKIPVILNVFDVLFYKKETFSLPLKERRVILEKLIKNINSDLIRTTEAIFTKDPKEVMKFFNHCLNESLEGIIAKDLEKPYLPGKRDFAWIKLKKNYLKGQFDSVDLVIMGYFLGNGKYANKPSSFLCGIYDKEINKFKAVAKVASGLKEKDVDFFNDKFKDIKLSKKPENYETSLKPHFYILPKFIVEVIFDEITKSPLYNDSKGYSLRFPRFVMIRDDKTPFETTNEKELRELYNLQNENRNR